ncbi:MAG TPA: tetratricopeptide repeat protein [Terriglobia bacterium]|nr:tetratricopeptide repeat protein [Terriglobia bacterium]
MMALDLTQSPNARADSHHPFRRRGLSGGCRLGLLLLLTLGSGCMLPAAQSRGAVQSEKLPALEVLERAHAQFSQGDYDRARQNYLKVLTSFPDNFDILRDLGACYFVTGPRGYAEAARYYERAYAINPRASEVAQKLSRCYMGLKKYQEAAAVEMKLARLPNAPAEGWKRAAEAYDAAGDYGNAREAYMAYLQRKPGDLPARCQLARLDGLNKNYNYAAGQYRIVLSSNPDFIPALVGMARIYSWQGQLDKSLELYNRVLRFEPDNGEALSGKAFALLWQKRSRQAHEIFERLHLRYLRDAEVKRGLDESQREIESEAFAAAQKNGNVSELIDYYREQAAKNPNDVETLKALTSFSADAHHCSQSIAYGRKAMGASNGAPAVRLALARSLRLCGNYPEAVSNYRQYLQSNPGAAGVRYELGDTLRRARRFPESLQVFRQMLESDPQNADAQVGLAQSLAATGEYDEALSLFNQVLRKHPGYYDALQGKAYVLFWKDDFNGAQTIFEALAKKNPGDPQNAAALQDITRAEETTHWKALRPAADASPQVWLDFYRKRLASDPKDRDAMKGLAYEESRLNQQNAALQDYRRVLETYPDDRDSKLELARLLSLDRQYPAAIALYRQALQPDPGDTQILAGLARVYVWSGQPEKALPIYEQLLSGDPSNAAYLLATGQMEIQLKQYDAARESLGRVLAADPANRNARLELARLNTSQGQYDAALKEYEVLLNQNPQDPDALLGKARISFYQGKLSQAHAAATEAVEKRPDDFSSVFLLASIEHAQHHRHKTLSLIGRAEKLSPGDAEVASLRNQVLSESRVTLSTTVAYAREIGPPSQSNGRTGLANEDLRMYTYGTTVGLNLFPKTNSYFSFISTPTDSPPGPVRDSLGNQIPTGITGATAPYEFLYRQSTRFNRRLTVRAGAGFVRFGPGALVPIPGQTALINGATQRPVGLAGVSLGLANKLSLDLDASRSAITYTPVSTRLGVIQDRLQGRVNYFFDSRTQLHLAYWYGHYSSEDYFHAAAVNGIQAEHDQGQGGSIIFNRQVLHSPGFSLDAGYEGYLYGFAGQDRNVFLGFFNPSFYQRHEFVPRIYGPLWGPLGYDLSAGIGFQQTGRGEAITRAWNVSPNLSVRVSRHLRLIFGYTHYNTAQILGPLRGNEVRFGTEWQY